MQAMLGALRMARITGCRRYGSSIAASLGGRPGRYGQLRVARGGVQRVVELLDTSPSIQEALS